MCDVGMARSAASDARRVGRTAPEFRRPTNRIMLSEPPSVRFSKALPLLVDFRARPAVVSPCYTAHVESHAHFASHSHLHHHQYLSGHLRTAQCRVPLDSGGSTAYNLVEPQHRNCPARGASRAHLVFPRLPNEKCSLGVTPACHRHRDFRPATGSRRCLLSSSTMQHRVAGAPAGRTVHPSHSYLPRRAATQTRKVVSVDAQAQARPRLPALDLLTSAPGVLLCLDSVFCSPTFCILASLSSIHFLLTIPCNCSSFTARGKKAGPFPLPVHRQSSSSASQEPEESTLQISNQLVQQSFIMLFLNVVAVVAIATGASAAAIIPRLERLAQFRVFGATMCNYDNLGVSVAVEGDASFGTCTSLKGDDFHSIFATTIHDDCHLFLFADEKCTIAKVEVEEEECLSTAGSFKAWSIDCDPF
ncbi:hypothetical protein Purlil1_9702 [Purpureocillium lilacinum]|uniref:Uncharacterized protein n=1 Tax=Purpureocillium lilacinum TaxID=33203 RepID=A0ABR0BPJ9_PURLI|nr:hypothetical protein Purlil1_9702 [Purpureocillium lilacinum]